jgi:Uma2 family endonuclease
MRVMATTTPVMSWEAFEQLPDDGMHYEILEGELMTLPPPKSRHSLVAGNTFKALLPLEQRGLGRVMLEAGYKLSEDPATWIQPDVSFFRKERVQATAPNGYFLNAPELAIEIVSPSESARDLERKVDALLAVGSHAVWVIYPETQKVRVFLRDGTSYSRGVHEKLTAPDLLPDWELPVAKLFE